MKKSRLLFLPVLMAVLIACLMVAIRVKKEDPGQPAAQSVPETTAEETTAEETTTEETTTGEMAAEETTAEAAPPEETAPESVSFPAEPARSAAEPDPQPDWDFHIVVNGDSRTVCLYCSLAYSEEEFPQHLFTHHLSETYSADIGNMTFVAKGGEGYDFFSTYGLALASTHFDERSVLVVWFGVNDAERADQYVAYMNNVSLQFGIPVYYMTVGPCYDRWTVREPGVEEMNRKLRENLRPEIRVIDTFSFIQDGVARGEFGTLDGLHYNYHTCQAVCAYIQQVLEADYAAGRMEFHYVDVLGKDG